MTKTSKIDRCFDIVLPEAMQLLHDINYEHGLELHNATSILRNYLRNRYNKKQKIDWADEEFLDKLMNVVNAHGNYMELMNLIQIVKDKMPENAIRVINRDDKADQAECQKRHQEFLDNIKILFSSTLIETMDLNEPIKIICEYIMCSENEFHDLRDKEA